MTTQKKQKAGLWILIALLLLIAYICGIPNLIYMRASGLVRSYIYIGLFSVWGFSIRKRIIQVQMKQYMTAIVILMVFWFLIRSLKYYFFPSDLQPVIARYLWYLYYLPMLFIPMLTVLVAMSIGKPENVHLPGKAILLCIPTALLCLLVLTNDLHQFVFAFSEDALVWTDRDYQYAIGYFLVIGWLCFCTLLAIGLLWKNCRIPGRRKRIIFPCIPIMGLGIYLLLYISKVEWVRFFFGDMTALICLLYALSLELCTQFGFIQVNTHYEELFSAMADIPVQILDQHHKVRYASQSAEPISQKLVQAAADGPVMLPDGKRLHTMPIHGGQVIWTEDITELLRLQEKLKNRKEELEDRNGLLQYEYEREVKHQAIQEQNRLYELLESKTQKQIDQINRLAADYQRTENAEEKKWILSQIVILGSYVKRRKDFALSIDSSPNIEESKLTSALSESFRSLSQAGIQGSYLIQTGKSVLKGEVVTLAYDFFEDTAEASLCTLRSIDIRVAPVKGKLRISILADGDGDFSVLKEKYPEAVVNEEEDGVSLFLPLEGGDPI